MANVEGAYCALEDLRKGDIPLPPYMGDGTLYIKGAAEEIDAALGHMYDTPFDVENPLVTRPAVLVLKKINWLIASGRLVLDLATAGESLELHAYGKSMLDEGIGMLMQVASGELVLTGAPGIPQEENPDGTKPATGPMIHNEDSESLVQSFYDRHNLNLPIRFDAPEPYENSRN